MPTPVDFEFPEYSVLAATRVGKLTLSRPVPRVATATATQKFDSEEQVSASASGGADGGNEDVAVPAPGHNSARVTTDHLAYRYCCQRQCHEPQAHVVGVDHVGSEEADHSPEDDAVGKIDRESHLEETQAEERPISGKDDEVANPLTAVLSPNPPNGVGRAVEQGITGMGKGPSRRIWGGRSQ